MVQMRALIVALALGTAAVGVRAGCGLARGRLSSPAEDARGAAIYVSC